MHRKVKYNLSWHPSIFSTYILPSIYLRIVVHGTAISILMPNSKYLYVYQQAGLLVTKWLQSNTRSMEKLYSSWTQWGMWKPSFLKVHRAWAKCPLDILSVACKQVWWRWDVSSRSRANGSGFLRRWASISAPDFRKVSFRLKPASEGSMNHQQGYKSSGQLSCNLITKQITMLRHWNSY